MRILTWNTQGSRAAEKAEEINGIIDYWLSGDPLTVICLQEVAVTEDAVGPLLRERGFRCTAYREGWNHSGRMQMIATASDLDVSGWGRMDNMNLTRDERGLNVRIPMYCEIVWMGKHGIVYNYHAESPASLTRWNMLQKVSRCVARQVEKYDFAVFAGDLNTFDRSEIRRVFPEFDGVNYRYDYILARNIGLRDGIHSDRTASDHRPVSAGLIFECEGRTVIHSIK